MVCVFPVTASISLHAGELLPDRSTASEAPRVGLFHQPRFSGIQARQVTGRTHRDGQVSPWRGGFAADTVGEQEGRVLVERSEEHTAELHTRPYLVSRLLLQKKRINSILLYITYK